MNRVEFMTKLSGLLADISQEEREEALQFYENYFADAGVEHEAEIIKELGSPERVAVMIKADLGENATTSGEFTEKGYTDERFAEKKSPAKYTESHQKSNPPLRTNKWIKILLIVLIGIVILPFGGTFIFTILSVLFSIIVAVISACFALVIAAIAIMVAGFALVIGGIVLFITAPPVASLLVGIGLIIFVLGLLATVGTIKLCVIVYPAMFRWIVALCRRPFHKKGGASA